MITITVHHQHQQQPCAICSHLAQTAPIMQQENKPKTKHNTSSVQVQYQLARRHFREASGKINVDWKPVGLAAGQGDTYADQRLASFNSVEAIKQRAGSTRNRTETSAASQSSSSQSLLSENKKSNKLHSRSISLIINPEFSSDSSSSADNELLATNDNLCQRRRTASRQFRRTRLPLMGSQPTLCPGGQIAAAASTAFKDTCQVKTLVPDACNAESDSLKSTAQISRIERMGEADASLRHDKNLSQEDRSRSHPDALERFRQAGIILRNISDEFSR